MILSIVSVVLFRIININEVVKGMSRIFCQIVTGKLGQNFLEASLYSVTLLLLVSVLKMTIAVFSDETMNTRR